MGEKLGGAFHSIAKALAQMQGAMWAMNEEMARTDGNISNIVRSLERQGQTVDDLDQRMSALEGRAKSGLNRKAPSDVFRGIYDCGGGHGAYYRPERGYSMPQFPSGLQQQHCPTSCRTVHKYPNCPTFANAAPGMGGPGGLGPGGPGGPVGFPQNYPTPLPPPGGPNPMGSPAGNPMGNPTGNPAGNPMGNPTGNPMGSPAGNPMGNPAGSPMGNPVGIPTGNPGGGILSGPQSGRNSRRNSAGNTPSRRNSAGATINWVEQNPQQQQQPLQPPLQQQQQPLQQLLQPLQQQQPQQQHNFQQQNPQQQQLLQQQNFQQQNLQQHNLQQQLQQQQPPQNMGGGMAAGYGGDMGMGLGMGIGPMGGIGPIGPTGRCYVDESCLQHLARTRAMAQGFGTGGGAFGPDPFLGGAPFVPPAFCPLHVASHPDLPLALAPPPTECAASSDDRPSTCRKSTESRSALMLAAMCKKLHRAVGSGRAGCVKGLLDEGADPNCMLGEKWQPLHKACAGGAASVVSLLLKRGAVVNARDCRGRTPLHIAAVHDASTQILSLLLEAGGDVRSRDPCGRTPLHLAALTGNEGCVCLLLRAGASVSAEDNRGRRPWDVAKTVSVRRLVCVRRPRPPPGPGEHDCYKSVAAVCAGAPCPPQRRICGCVERLRRSARLADRRTSEDGWAVQGNGGGGGVGVGGRSRKTSSMRRGNDNGSSISMRQIASPKRPCAPPGFCFKSKSCASLAKSCSSSRGGSGQ